MKKFICLSIVILFVIGLTGCGKNPVFTKLSSSGGSAVNSSAAASKLAVTVANSSAGGFSGGSPSFSGAPSSELEPSVDPTTGWITQQISSQDGTITIKYRWLTADGTPITGENLTAIYISAMTDAKKFAYQFNMSGSIEGGSSFTFTSDMLVTYTTVGDLDMDDGGSVSGTMTMVDSVCGTFNITLSNVTATKSATTGKPIVNSGTITVTYNSADYGTWTVNLTFNSDGSADGTITGPGYSATMHVNADGTGTYTDSSGTHAIL